MNSEDRKRLRKQKHRIMMMRLWLPVVLVVVLVVGLTAGGIAMSLGQTKSVAEQGTKEDGTKNVETKEASNESKEAGDVNGEAQTVDQAGADKQQSEEAQTGAESDNSQAGNEDDDSNHAIEQSDFDEFITNLNEAVAQNSNYLKRESENLTRTLAELQTYDRTHLTEAQAKTYDALLDALNVEMDGDSMTVWQQPQLMLHFAVLRVVLITTIICCKSIVVQMEPGAISVRYWRMKQTVIIRL